MKEQERREIILHNYVKFPDISYRALAKKLKMAKTTVTYVLNRYKGSGSITRKKGSGGKRFGRNDLKRRIDGMLKRNPRLSLQDLGVKVKTSTCNVHRIKRILNYRTRKVQKAPNRSYKQNLTARSRARKLYDELLCPHKGCVIMDDETYLKADFKQMPGNEHYSVRDGRSVSDDVRLKKVDKFAKKYMIWQALCTCGKSSSIYVCEGSMKAEEYLKECLQKRLLKLYQDHDIPPLFWPDLATIHYARSVMSWYEVNNIKFVPKTHNPPNTPEIRNIENYWSHLKRVLIKKFSAAVNLSSFKSKVVAAGKSFTREAVQSQMMSVQSRVRKFARGEPLK